VNIVSYQGVEVRGGQTPERRSKGGDFFASDHLVGGVIGGAQVDESRQVTLAPFVPPAVRDCGIAGRDDGIAGEGVRRETVPCVEELGEAVLGEVFDEVLVGQSGPEHATDERCERDNVVGFDIGGLSGYHSGILWPIGAGDGDLARATVCWLVPSSCIL